MKKVWIIVAIFSLLVTLNAKEVVGKYISYEQWAESWGVSFQIDGKEKSFQTFDPLEEKILEKLKNKFVRIKYYSEDGEYGGEILENIYFNDGTTAFKEEHQSNSLFSLDANEKACNNGDAQKCYELAQANAEFLEATGYYNTACEGGHAKACYELASIYELGNKAVQKDVELAKKYYKLACKNGISDACGANKQLDIRNRIGLKDLYLDQSKIEACNIVQKYSNIYDSKFVKTENECKYTYLSVSFINNRVYKIYFDGWLTDELYNVRALDYKEFAQLFIENVSWIYSLEHKRHFNPFWKQWVYYYEKKNAKQGWAIKIDSNKAIILQKINKPTF